jgi:hypothetical protein
VLTRESDSEFVTDVKGVCEGVAVWQGDTDDDTDTELVTDAKGDWDT